MEQLGEAVAVVSLMLLWAGAYISVALLISADLYASADQRLTVAVHEQVDQTFRLLGLLFYVDGCV